MDNVHWTLLTEYRMLNGDSLYLGLGVLSQATMAYIGCWRGSKTPHRIISHYLDDYDLYEKFSFLFNIDWNHVCLFVCYGCGTPESPLPRSNPPMVLPIPNEFYWPHMTLIVFLKIIFSRVQALFCYCLLYTSPSPRDS